MHLQGRLIWQSHLVIALTLAVSITAIAHYQQPQVPNTISKYGIVVPLFYNPPLAPWPAVEVSIDGKPPLVFILDTGSDAALILDEWAIPQLNLPITQETGHVNGRETKMAKVDMLAFKGHYINGVRQDLVFQLSYNKVHVLNQPQLKHGYATSAYGGSKLA